MKKYKKQHRKQESKQQSKQHRQEVFSMETSTSTATATPTASSTQNQRTHAFTFGEPERVLVKDMVLDNMFSMDNGQWFDTPISFEGLAKSFRANPHHETALRFKRDVLVRSFIEHPLLSTEAFSAMALDFSIFGNAYLERRTSITGELLPLQHALAKYTRLASDGSHYVYLQQGGGHGGGHGLNGHSLLPYGMSEPHHFNAGAVFHLKEPDIHQEVYGLPVYLSALQSVWLNEDATLFRRRYFKNGSHAGYILYATDAELDDEDVEELQRKLEQSKGPGNFRNLFIHAPGGKKDGLQLMPIGEVSARDEFLNVKNVSRDDILVPHRTPPQLLGLVPQNSGGFGSIKDAAHIFLTLEIVPIQNRFKALNRWLGVEVMQFMDLRELLGLIVGEVEI